MDFLTLLILSAGLATDAFAVSVCKGMSMKKTGFAQALTAGLWFGGFQALMPVAGYFIGSSFIGLISAWDHWIAFGLLALIGVNMIWEAVKGTSDDGGAKTEKNPLAFRTMLVAAIATSIDALAVGVSFAAVSTVNIWYAAATIGIVTLIFSFIGVKAGHLIGRGFASKAEIIGGTVLICIGVKILIEHMVA